MKANELRIGSTYILDNEVITLSQRHFYVASDNAYNLEQRLDPIPLTEEWLLKFGFESDISQAGEEYSKGQFFLLAEPWDGKSDTVVLGRNFGFDSKNHLDVEIKYVHQLQNLFFALTGEELTVN